MQFPDVFVFDASEREDDAARELARHVSRLGIEAPFVVTSPHGMALARDIDAVGREVPVDKADQAWAIETGSRAQELGADAIVAVGGGRCLDLGKLAAARAGLILLAVPTQLSHDGICSPVAVVPPNGSSCGESLGAIAPRGVFFSLPTLMRSPAPSLRAGLGDLLANPLALRDWALAAEHGLEQTNAQAWDLSVESFELIEGYLDGDPASLSKDPAFVRTLGDALALSGMAMICAGTSRPASGAEHEISHAIDEHLGGRALHGAQVAFGCVFSVALYGEDTDAFRARLRRLGLPAEPAALGLEAGEVRELLLRAPETRPGRFTVLEQANLDETTARALVNEIFATDAAAGSGT